MIKASEGRVGNKAKEGLKPPLLDAVKPFLEWVEGIAMGKLPSNVEPRLIEALKGLLVNPYAGVLSIGLLKGSRQC